MNQQQRQLPALLIALTAASAAAWLLVWLVSP
jgi:hypothetical protein